MAMYSLSFSAAHIVSSKLGMTIIDHWGYQINWLVMVVLSFIAVVIGLVLYKKHKFAVIKS
jgi:predicted MFS family arabinose efflux permease